MNYDTIFIIIIINDRRVIWEEMNIDSTIQDMKNMIFNKYKLKKYYMDVEDEMIYNVNHPLIMYAKPENENAITIRIFTKRK